MATSNFAMIQVQSVIATAVGYDSKTCTLRIFFRNGEVYDYANVDGRLAYGFADADTIGGRYTELVRGQYSFTRIG